MTTPTALRLTEDDLEALEDIEDPVAELWRRRREQIEAERERRKRAREKTVHGAAKMIEQLRRRPKARADDPQTAHDAAVQAMEAAPNLEQRLLFAFHEFGPMTAEEAAKSIGHDPWSASTHVSTLKKHDPPLVVETGETRETDRGGTAQVLRCAVGPVTPWRQAELELEED